MLRRERFSENLNLPLLGMAIAIVAAGCVNVYSAVEQSRPELFLDHLRWVTVGLGALYAMVRIDYRLFEKLAWPLYLAGLAGLIATLLFGRTISGSVRWLPLGVAAVQTSELMKLVFIVALARHFHDRETPRDGYGLRQVAGPAGLTAIPFLLILKQPDLGTATIFAVILASLLLIFGLRIRTLLLLLALALVVAPLAWTFVLKEYQRDRVLSLIDPERDVQGTGYHVRQSKIAIGSGRLWGKGYRQGTQSRLRFLPEQHTDFVFSVWAEEHGLIGAAGLLALYAGLLLAALKVAARARERFGALLVTGIAAMLFWQAVFNIGMVTGLVPVVGLTLPLFSYGGSSMLVSLAGIGLILSVDKRRFMF